jgi:hypothetical protein
MFFLAAPLVNLAVIGGAGFAVGRATAKPPVVVTPPACVHAAAPAGAAYCSHCGTKLT